MKGIFSCSVLPHTTPPLLQLRTLPLKLLLLVDVLFLLNQISFVHSWERKAPALQCWQCAAVPGMFKPFLLSTFIHIVKYKPCFSTPLQNIHKLRTIVTFIPFFVFCFWSLLPTKLRNMKLYAIFVYISQGKMGKMEKKRGKKIIQLK